MRCIQGAVLLNLLLLLHGTLGSENTCGVGLNTPGVTIPRGDIILHLESDLKILCILDKSHPAAAGKNSSHLVFFHDYREVPEEFVTVVNSTTLQLYIKRPPVSSSMYYCKLKDTPDKDMYTAVCLNKVIVDKKPDEVQNISCISKNWQSLTCSWKKPLSFVKTTYDLYFRLPGRAGGRMHYKCPEILENDTYDSCFWDITTDPHYRQPYEYYYFTLTASNVFGNWSKQFEFHHYSHVIPDPPPELTIVDTMVNSAILKWSVPFPMQLFPPGLTPKVEYQSLYDERDKWLVANTSSLYGSHNETYIYTLDGLKYANTLYDIRVYLRSALAVGDDRWSAPTINTFRTKATIPGEVPKTDIGSFEVSGGLPYRDVYIYWQQIPEHLKNGDKFEYKIISVEENGLKRSLTPDETTNAYAKFRGISFNSFRFKIVAANEKGHSKDVSEVYVPSKTEIPPEPVSFTKIALTKTEYELSWKPPASASDRNKINSYTIFWCNHERDRPYQCTGFLNWTHVPSNITFKKIRVPEDKIYQFAISANTKNASSGMIWASCTVIHNKVVDKMKSVWINRIGATYIEVGWKLDCSDRIGTVRGFNIYYCPIVSPYNLSCKEHELNTTVLGDPQTIHGNITNLKPYTIYMVAIAVITQSGEGLQSEPLYNTTLEAAPVAPDAVNITEITNTSMVVTWQPPKSLNGALRYYDVLYGIRTKRLNVNTNERPEAVPVSMKLENLTSYHNYTVSVVACTTACSEKSPPVTVQTDIGAPDVVEPPSAKNINSSMVLVSWKPPPNPGGPLDYYEVTVIKVDEKSRKNVTYVYNTTATESQIHAPNCESGGSVKYVFHVRAVNMGTNNVKHYGQWSGPVETSCYRSDMPQEVLIAIYVGVSILLIILSLVIFYFGKSVWQRCKEMQDVQVKLPPGLVPSEKEKGHEYWPTVDVHDHITGKSRSNASADEEYLLDKKEERHGRNLSGDSSGCSSGHESVSSSLTSDTRSSSDSGTEADQHVSAPDGVFPDSTTWESSGVMPSLRQRSVGALRPEESSDSYVKMGRGGGSGSVARSTPNLTELEGLGVGVGPGGVGMGFTCLGTSSSQGYISMPSSQEMESRGGGYCRVGTDGKSADSQSPRHQLQQTQIAQPHKGYVSLASMSDTSPSTLTTHSCTHSSPHQPRQQPPGLKIQGYVNHQPLWSVPKETSSGKGCVITGELPNKGPSASVSLLTSEVEEGNQGILGAELTFGEENHEDEELHSPESYCRFGLRPGMIPGPVPITLSSNAGMMEGILEPEQERTSSKPGAGYVTLSDEPRLQNTKSLGIIPGCHKDQRVGVSGGSADAASGYVPHRHFEKRDSLALSQTPYQDYNEVFPPSIDDTSHITSV